MSARKFIIGAAIVATGLAGGSVAASDYPPDVPPSTHRGRLEPRRASRTPQAIQRADGRAARDRLRRRAPWSRSPVAPSSPVPACWSSPAVAGTRPSELS